ncbi:hypothetical protein NBRC10512_007659 [Rhodotorula toruloides]|uniref:RHTO0S05e00826g1_1 n=2 Tax=Rhodotorula toruloides TaxID=5286 RepID=A0A061ASZ1_RHOTO|nr:uncharacterized protein RHTO_02365 [Rhodotorula toruloides NP11]EMS20750.1 hypothetical protein RHTO_02365 [Rhodotorula toruloides NP11]CDR40292.1 RHTO0S05e00826g1_1 [Rhodotorula toruloides]
MQFPKAKRFVDKPPDTIPPPGAYDVPIALPDPSYKKAGMLEKGDRFAMGERDVNKPDTFGLYNPDGTAGDKENARPKSRAAGTTSSAALHAERERHKRELEDLRARLSASHEKEVSKAQAKVDKLTKRTEELKKEREELGKEKDGLKSEVRHLTSKLAKTTTLLEKHQQSLPSLQSKLESLTAQHTASSQRKDSEIATLRGRLEEVEKNLFVERGRYAVLKRDKGSVDAALEREKQGRAEQATAAGEAVLSARVEARVARQGELYEARMREVKLRRQVEDRIAQVESLAAYAAGLEERVKVAEESREEAEWQRWRIRDLWRDERELMVGPERNEKEWRQRARADLRDASGLRDEIASAEEEKYWRVEWDEEARLWMKGREKRWDEEKRALKKELSDLEKELDHAVNTDIPRLETQLSSTEDALADTKSSLSTAEEQVSDLSSALADLEQRLADETERLEGEIEEQKRHLADARKEVERERTEKRRVVGLLAQTRASETALKEEVEILSADVTSLRPLIAETTSLRQTIDHLARLNAANEAEAQQLIAQNSELVGHGNKDQKIRHVAALREELVESRKKHLATLSQLASVQQRVASLETELETYRPASTDSAVPSSGLAPQRARVSRPQMADAVSASSAVPAPPAPRVVVSSSDSHAPLSHSLAVAAPTTSVTWADDDPLLPPHLQLAASQPAPSAGVGKARGRAAIRERRGSTSVKMVGKMSVSELLG